MKKEWFIHSAGETFGPIPTNAIRIMLEQKRINSTEFIWSLGMERWQRILELSDFADSVDMPPYPAVPIPTSVMGGNQAPKEKKQFLFRRARPTHEPATTPPPVADPDTVSTETEITLSNHPAPEEVSAAPQCVSQPRPDAQPIRPPEPLQIPELTPDAVLPTSSSTEERDRKIRFAPRIPVEATITIDVYGTLNVVDLSETGVLFRCENPIRPGTHLEFVIESGELEKTSLRMTGVVARNVTINDIGHTAIEFTRVNPAFKRILKEFVARKSSTKEERAA